MIHDWISSQFRELRGSYIRQLPIILAIKVLPETRPHCVDLPSLPCTELVHRLAYKGDVAAGQLAVFQGASEAPISEFIRVERATQKNGQLAAGRRLRCSSLRIDSDMRPPSASPARTVLPAGDFERNAVVIICETAHQGLKAAGIVAGDPANGALTSFALILMS